jgi:hypothetical protein
MPNENDPNSDPSKGDGGSNGNHITIEVDGESKSFSPDDIQNLVSQQAAATQKTQQVSAVLKACNKFDMNPEVFVGQAEGAFDVIANLIDAGVVDEQGNIIQKEVQPKRTDVSFGDTNRGVIDTSSEDKMLGVINKVLEPLAKKFEALEKDQMQLTRLRVNDTISGKFDNLDERDMSEIFATAGADKTKTLMQHAGIFSEKKKGNLLEQKKALAKELGVDYDEFTANALREQGSDGGAAGFLKDKKISFKKGKDSLSPKAAMADFLKRFK